MTFKRKKTTRTLPDYQPTELQILQRDCFQALGNLGVARAIMLRTESRFGTNFYYGLDELDQARDKIGARYQELKRQLLAKREPTT